MTMKVSMRHRVLEFYQVCSSDDIELTLTYFTARSNLVPYAFVWEEGKTMDFSETIVVCGLKLATDDQCDKKFLLTSKRCPLGMYAPLPRGYIHILNKTRKLYKIRLQRHFFETCNKWMKWQEISVDVKTLPPVGLPAPAPGLCNCIKSWKKNSLKSDFKEIFLKLIANDQWQDISVDIKILSPQGLSSPDFGYIHLLNHEQMCIKSEVEEILFKLATNDHSDEVFVLL